MTKFNLFRKGWTLLDERERRRAKLVLIVVVFSAFTAALMVSSVMPFLAVLADPALIREVEAFKWSYKFGGFETDFGFLIALGVLSMVAIIVANLIQMLRLYLVTNFATMRMHTLSTRLLQIYLRHPYEYFLDAHSGELGTEILAETQQVVQNFFRPVAEAIAAGLTVIAIVTLLVSISPSVAVVSLVVAGGLYLVCYVSSRKVVRRFGDTRAAANRSRFKVANEALAGIKEVKLLGREVNYVTSYALPSFEMAKAESMAIFIGTLPQYVMQMVAFGGMIALILVLLEPSALSEGNTMGGLLPLLGVFAFGGQRLIPELTKLYSSITLINYGAPSVESIYKAFQSQHTLPPLPADDTAQMALTRSFELRDVSYAYPNTEGSSLVDVSFIIKSGEKIGIVGGSGAGKTTLADLIMGLLRPQKGQVLVDETMVAENNILSWQRSVGYVQQGIFLSDASILENIGLGISKDQIDRDRALEAGRKAQLDDFVLQNLPAGYDTLIGERGVRLSGGQRQRIGIARALYNDADLIVFDEATSALDNITEKQVMDSIAALPGNKTVVLIAHRLSTLAQCDRLIVLDKGKIVGIGTWGELRSKNPYFQKLESAAATKLGVM
jgi:ABC-type bacteriocin/lantibiotic exporter with double-glycine peptidase domain